MAAERHDSAALEAASTLLGRLGLDEPPVTPGMVLEELGLEVGTLPSFDLERLDPEQLQLFGSVKGLLSPSESKIYVSEELVSKQERWVIFHEGAHAEIGWHTEILYLDNEYTLGPAVKEQMEKEANGFAAHLQFFGPRFAADARDLPFGIASIRSLADRYGTSIESSLRHYVETRQEQCICAVFRLGRHPDGSRETLTFQYFVKSAGNRAFWRFPCKVGDTLPMDDPLVILLNEGKLTGNEIHQDTRYDLKTETAYLEEAFCNGHSVFLLVRKL